MVGLHCHLEEKHAVEQSTISEWKAVLTAMPSPVVNNMARQ